jgi:hypothetical protein
MLGLLVPRSHKIVVFLQVPSVKRHQSQLGLHREECSGNHTVCGYGAPHVAAWVLGLPRHARSGCFRTEWYVMYILNPLHSPPQLPVPQLSVRQQLQWLRSRARAAHPIGRMR